ncbi:TetR/AcrR family transcriptional regulator [Bailinhaonella thermotolerans]|uniref:TetR/AcrR family transcriptional regulator n=1 Tax=Bailinhaonella thermotolerans TaxID=1070861 RepID=A0A3A4BAK0_9ACTN|nr:TetR/AcrR family transcriptional regulator [Bailinhaonella thermotolerans]RJL35613.1 TetR/AcrR family transcriptional regulator [Bailinhaonella thermotolerans]
MGTQGTRLSKQARREQLLDAATAIVRDQGAAHLTLPTLAEAAQVSRPIVYDHFGTRQALLIALYRRLDEQYRAALTRALADAGTGARGVARLMAEAYLTCATTMPELNAISAALKGSPEMEAIQHELLDDYIELMTAALAPHTGQGAESLRLRCVGVLGAAEAIAAELNHGRTTTAGAIAALTDVVTGCLVAGPGRNGAAG